MASFASMTTTMALVMGLVASTLSQERRHVLLPSLDARDQHTALRGVRVPQQPPITVAQHEAVWLMGGSTPTPSPGLCRPHRLDGGSGSGW